MGARGRHLGWLGIVLAGLAAPCVAASAAAGEKAGDRAFTGAYAGPELGVHEHHFYLTETDKRTGTSQGRYYRAWGVGGGAFAGYDAALTRRIRLGAEIGVSVGGNNPVARFSDGTFYTQHPRYGFEATGKLGYLLADRVMAYGTFGYGGHRYRLGGTAAVADVDEWGSSFTIGAGVEYRASSNIGVRLDFRHLDNQRSHWLLGIPIRF
ncbi:MAG: outer rane immunogenic protein [Sphingomonadales bacterium]|nr:outer rane immunogenic protein [Sphingomonadales bacterium]